MILIWFENVMELIVGYDKINIGRYVNINFKGYGYYGGLSVEPDRKLTIRETNLSLAYGMVRA